MSLLNQVQNILPNLTDSQLDRLGATIHAHKLLREGIYSSYIISNTAGNTAELLETLQNAYPLFGYVVVVRFRDSEHPEEQWGELVKWFSEEHEANNYMENIHKESVYIRWAGECYCNMHQLFGIGDSD